MRSTSASAAASPEVTTNQIMDTGKWRSELKGITISFDCIIREYFTANTKYKLFVTIMVFSFEILSIDYRWMRITESFHIH